MHYELQEWQDKYFELLKDSQNKLAKLKNQNESR